MITVDTHVKIKALPVSLEVSPHLIGKKGVVKEIDPYLKNYTMYSVDLGKDGVLVFGPKHIEKA